MPHALAAGEGVRFLEIHTPGSGFGAFLRALHDAGDGDEAAAAARTGFDRLR